MFISFPSECTPQKERYFQEKLLEYIEAKRVEAGHVEPTPVGNQDVVAPQAEPRIRTPSKIAIYWMFDQLDVSPMDRLLTHSEADSFFTEISREVGPRACSTIHWERCDYNHNTTISLAEWCWCNGLDPGKCVMCLIHFLPVLTGPGYHALRQLAQGKLCS